MSLILATLLAIGGIALISFSKTVSRLLYRYSTLPLNKFMTKTFPRYPNMFWGLQGRLYPIENWQDCWGVRVGQFTFVLLGIFFWLGALVIAFS